MNKKQLLGVSCLVLGCLMGSSHLSIQATSSNKQTCTTLKECDSIIGNLEDQMNQIDKQEQEKEAEKKDLQAQRFQLRTEVTQIQNNIIALKADIKSLEDEIRFNEFKQAELEGKLKLLRTKMNYVIVLDHRLQRKNLFLSIVSESESLVDFIRNARVYYHITRQAKDYSVELSELVEEYHQIIDDLTEDKATLESKRTELERDEKSLVQKMEAIILIEQQIQKELQRLQSVKMEANEVLKIMEEQKKAIVNSTNDTFGIPLASGYVTCRFNCYVDKNGIPHNGIDLGNYGDTSTKVLASASGTVVRAGWHSAYGNHVMITHNIKGVIYTTVYAHMHTSPTVSVGQSVKKGQVLGTMGSTGNSTGPHLHFELYKGYYNWPHSVNPENYITFPSKW